MKKFLIIILVFILAFGGIFGLSKCSNSNFNNPLGNNELSKLQVFCENKELQTTENILFYTNSVNFEVQCNKTYTVSIVFSSEESFVFTLNGKKFSSVTLGDITKFFNISYTKKGFLIKFENDFSIENLIDKICSSQMTNYTLELPELSSEKFYFKMLLIDDITNETIKLGFNYFNDYTLVLNKDFIII